MLDPMSSRPLASSTDRYPAIFHEKSGVSIHSNALIERWESPEVAARRWPDMFWVPTWPFPTAAEVLATDVLTVSNIDSSGSVSVSEVEADL